MVEFRGSHGTTATRARAIRDNGFRTGHGVHGSGVYFWRESIYSRDLAVGWHFEERNRGKYSQDPDKRCAIIYAVIVIDDEERFLDLTRPENREIILERIHFHGKKSELDIGKLIDEFIDLVQERSGVPFQIVLTTVPSPKKADNYPWRSMGQPFAYIVKDATCIRIEDIEFLEN